MVTFNELKLKYSNNDLLLFSLNEYGILWLKIKSILRKDIIKDFLIINGIILQTTKLEDNFEELYGILSSDVIKSIDMIDKYCIYKFNDNLIDIKNIEKELYKMKFFEWGGDYSNSLDKYFVTKYVKTKDIIPYNIITNNIGKDIQNSVLGYIVSSWYNYWSSVLIENIFKKQNFVVPAIGNIKNVDFFIKNIPFDLKVTIFPKGYMEKIRKDSNLKSEISTLKNIAKKFNISYDNNDDKNLQYEILERLKLIKNKEAKLELLNFKNEQIKIINDTITNYKPLIKYLYENQGDMRFGCENRIFIIVIDVNDIYNSWKLKRNIELLEKPIKKYINNFNTNNLDKLRIDFIYKNKKYTTYSDIIFIINQ